MLQQERHEQILARLNTDGKVKVKELAVDFEVTEDCIRKDLTALEKEGRFKTYSWRGYASKKESSCLSCR